MKRRGAIMDNTTYTFKGVNEKYESKDSLPVGGSVHTKIKVKRMHEALAAESIPMPSGLTKEEMRAFIIAHAKA
jgi:hypothetical protein